ncbi:MerR family transcriptional regulator [Bacillus massiliigorillae]|uniref:MerR family transcriptional regulator n=1 Tax=Bacillus massiliigorillae TaxID=1243664 RepID=UPI00039A886E|nr:MerR family transcriptional regulator [Bacillus massiliigorillae]
MKNIFTIGEISKLHNISIKTLRYYDEIGLFKPIETNQTNGYRYYSTEQFEQLNIIKYLRALGLSLKEIKTQFEQGSLENFVHLLEHHKERTDQKIKELQLISTRFQNRIEELMAVRQIKELGVVKLKKIEARRMVAIQENIFSEHQLELTLKGLENSFNLEPSLFIGRVGLTVSVHNLSKHLFNEYSSVFILLEDHHYDGDCSMELPQGDYVCINFNGKREDSKHYYHMLLKYIEDHHLKIRGDAIERMIVDEFISKDENEYLTEIQIPVT